MFPLPLCDLPFSPNYFKYDIIIIFITAVIITIDGEARATLFVETQRKRKCVCWIVTWSALAQHESPSVSLIHCIMINCILSSGKITTDCNYIN